MAWIDVVPAHRADPELRDAYEQVRGARGSIGNIIAVHSLNPRVMLAHMRLYVEVMFGASELERADREMLAVAVSAANRCHY